MAELGHIPAEWELRVGKLSLAPGDVLVVRVAADKAAHDDMQRVYREFVHVVGRGNPVLVITDDINLSLLTKADIESRLDQLEKSL